MARSQDEYCAICVLSARATRKTARKLSTNPAMTASKLMVKEMTEGCRRKPQGFTPGGEAALRGFHRFADKQREWHWGEVQHVEIARKTYQEKLRPTPAQ